MEPDEIKRCVASERFSQDKGSKPGTQIDEVSMTRSRSINRFHRFVAKKRRQGMRASLPHLRSGLQQRDDQLDVSDRLLHRSEQLDLSAELESLNED